VTASTGRRSRTSAAGGVVWRQDGPHLLVALVHRPRYEDWTLPKGKVNGAEPLLLAAVREVAEETGAEVQVGRRLNPIEYRVGDGRKQVTHWSMRYLDGDHQPSDEVDRVDWLTVAEATQRLTYPIDRVVLADFARLPADIATVLLMRHASAGKRSEFQGDDRLRPLDPTGRRHARASVRPLAAFRPARILAADRVRCEQTVAPLADQLGLPLRPAPEFSDEAFLAEPGRAVAALHRLAGEPGSTVICSQGDAIPGLLDELAAPAMPHVARKGSVWALSLVGRRVVAADYYSHPHR